MAFTAAVTINESRRNSPILRGIDIVFSLCLAFAAGQAAGFHVGQQADQWAIVCLAALVLFGTLGAILHAVIPRLGDKRLDG